MTQKKKNQPEEPVQDNAPIDEQSSTEMEELRRNMRSAKWADWLQKNQQQLIAGAVIVLLALAGAGLWSEKQKAHKESAAMMYFQALSMPDDGKRQSLLAMVIQDYPDTAYSILSHIQLATLADTEVHLQAVMNNNEATEELRWQARLDLAEYFIHQGKANDAQDLLNAHVGKQFDQLRYYLLSEISSGDEQQGYLQKALDAISNDAVLKSDIEVKLAKVGGA